MGHEDLKYLVRMREGYGKSISEEEYLSLLEEAKRNVPYVTFSARREKELTIFFSQILFIEEK